MPVKPPKKYQRTEPLLHASWGSQELNPFAIGFALRLGRTAPTEAVSKTTLGDPSPQKLTFTKSTPKAPTARGSSGRSARTSASNGPARAAGSASSSRIKVGPRWGSGFSEMALQCLVKKCKRLQRSHKGILQGSSKASSGPKKWCLGGLAVSSLGPKFRGLGSKA